METLTAHFADHPDLWLPALEQGQEAFWLPLLGRQKSTEKHYGLDLTGQWVVGIQDQIQNLDFYWIAALPLLDWTRQEFLSEIERAGHEFSLDIKPFEETLLQLVLGSGLKATSDHWQNLVLRWITPYDYEHVEALEHLVQHGQSQKVRHTARHKLKFF